jgi:hypothetical protein
MIAVNCQPPSANRQIKKDAQELFQNSFQKSLAPPRFFPD